MFNAVFSNDEELAQNTTSKTQVRKPSELYTNLAGLPVGDTWYHIESEVLGEDVDKFKAKVARYAKKGAGKFKFKTTEEGTFLKKVA